MTWDAVVVGAGPNGLSAAVTLAREGLAVLVLEANRTVGGAARTEALTLPGFRHDVGSAVYPMAAASPFLRGLPLGQHGLEWVHPALPLAHPLGGRRAAMLHRSLDRTAGTLGSGAGRRYARLVGPFVDAWPAFVDHVLDTPVRVPRNPALMARFGARALLPTHLLARTLLRDEASAALLAGAAAHSGMPIGRPPAAALGLVLLTAAHGAGWPFPRGGAGAITAALASLLHALGGTIRTGEPVRSLDELPPARAVLLALTPRQVARVAGRALPDRYRRKLKRWRYGPGAFKVDWALDDAIPWEAEDCRRAGTVHVGGTLAEIARAERLPARGRLAPKPFVLLAQPSLFDASRAPEGRHTAWAYTHVPNGWPGARERRPDAAWPGSLRRDTPGRDAADGPPAGAEMTEGPGGLPRHPEVRRMLEAMEARIEAFAPGFRDRIAARRVLTPLDLEAWDENLVGGDVNGGAATLGQLLGPPKWTRRPWSTPVPHLYVCSAATPPGGGVHGMCGHHAAVRALDLTFGLRPASAT